MIRNLMGTAGDAPPGQAEFTTVGTSTWTCPPGVFSISIVCIGPGGGSSACSSSYGTAGGGGGALRYVNDYSVTPGMTYSVVVPAGGPAATGSTSVTGTSASFGSSVCVAPGGGSGTEKMFGAPVGGAGGSGGTGTGGNGGAGAAVNADRLPGGGAGGYSGNGTAGNFGGGSDATGGAATGGYALRVAGGGVGLYGEGASGSRTGNGGKGGSGGADGGITSGRSGAVGGAYGGGACAGQKRENWPAVGAQGAVRIIWPGNLRQFPSTRTADE